MKIYEIGSGYTPIPAKVAAATESVVEELTKAFLLMDIDCEIIDISAKERLPHNLPITEVRVPAVFSRSDVSLGIIHKVKRVVYSIALASFLKKLLKKQKEKVVLHFHNQYNLFFFLKLVPKKYREKAVIAYTNHNGMWSLPYNEVKATINKRYFQEIAAMKGADVVFVLNSKMKENIVDNLDIDKNKVQQIANGVNTEVYCPLPKEEVNLSKEKFAFNGKKVILQVGSVYENKGQAKSVELLASILKDNKDIVFAYVGGIVSQEYFERVQKTASDFGIEKQVLYLGTTSPGEEMNLIYNMADATLFVSEYEGFPLVCIESLCAGVPVIICSDTISDFGDGSIKVDENSIEQVIKDVFSNKDSLSLAARDNAASNYKWSKIAQDYYNNMSV